MKSFFKFFSKNLASNSLLGSVAIAFLSAIAGKIAADAYDSAKRRMSEPQP